jgi:hypothetical protein
MAEVIQVPNTAYNPQAGYLAVPTQKGGNMDWHSCRESFHGSIIQCKEKKFFFACASTDEKQRVINFMQEVQNRVGVKEENRIKLSDTNRPTVLHVDPGCWWTKQNIRLSFLTALLRCGTIYTGDNFQAALFSRFYTTDTKTAVDRFINGNTHYVGKGSQWHQTFTGCSQKVDYAERVLIKEDDAIVSEASLKEAEHLIHVAKENNEFLAFVLAKSLDKFYQEGAMESSKGARKTHVIGEGGGDDD